MKILHINCNYLTTALHQTMVRHLSACGIENSVFAPAYSLNNCVIKPDGYVTAAECFNKWDRINYHGKQKKIFAAVDNSFNIKDFDAVHAYTLFTDGGIALKLKQKYGIPYVVAVRGTDVHTFLKYMPHLRSYGFSVLREASRVFFLSEAYMNRTLAYIPPIYREEIKNKSEIIPNGIDDFWIDNKAEAVKPADEKSIDVFYAGKINSQKCWTKTVEACRELIHRGYNASYTLVGSVQDKKFEKYLADNTFMKHYPPMNKEQLIEYYRKSDIFIMPSKNETFGLVYAEAMSQGVPVLYTKNEGFDGYFKDGEVGYAVSCTDAQNIADKAELVMREHARIAENCIKNAERFRWADIAKRYCDIYSEILK